MITATSSAQCGSSMMPARCCSPLEALKMIWKRYRSTEMRRARALSVAPSMATESGLATRVSLKVQEMPARDNRYLQRSMRI